MIGFRHVRSPLLALSLAAFALTAKAALPPWLPLAQDLQVSELTAEERYGEAVIRTDEDPQKLVRGRHWSANLVLRGASGDDPATAHWARWKPALLEAGWTAQEHDSHPFRVTLHRSGAPEAWGEVIVFGPDDIRLELVETGEDRLAMALPAPAATPEPIAADKGDFPYLPPPPGAVFDGGDRSTNPMLVTLVGPEGETQVPVAATSTTRTYRTPADLSNLDFALAYRDALLAAGWTVPRFSQGPNAGDALLVAHYTRDGRDLWAVLHHIPRQVSLEVGEPGQPPLADPLKSDCRVTLLGIFFDFDKATLKPESDSALARARDLIQANPGLPLEVQGHTDAEGSETYNQTLSEARAQSVASWLTANGVPPAQLTSRGYGETVPVADNDTDRGRAQNRRVELVCRR